MAPTMPRALIIGGSLGGLFAAHMLRRIGWEVDVFERVADDLAGRGAGLGTHDGLFEVAQRAGIAFDRDKGVAIDSYVCLDRAGRVIQRTPFPRVMTAWAQIYRPLRDRLPPQNYHAGRPLARVEQDADSVTAIFADGSRAQADLLIGADGSRSTVREQFLATLKPAYAGYIAWRALVPEEDIPLTAREGVFERYAFCLPDGELAMAYPVPARDGDTLNGKRSVNIVWYHPVDEATLADLCTDVQGHRHEVSIPPPLVRPEIVSDIKQMARALVARPIAEIFCRSTQPFFQPIYDLASPQLVFGRVALLGDAAYVARPHVGAGVTKAGQDAGSLADALVAANGDVAQALAAYDKARQEFGHWIVARSRELGTSLLARPPQPGAWSDPATDPRLKAALHDYMAIARDIREWGGDQRRAG